MITRPQVVAFDVIETLFSLDAVEARFEDAGLSSPAMDLWLARVCGTPSRLLRRKPTRPSGTCKERFEPVWQFGNVAAGGRLEVRRS